MTFVILNKFRNRKSKFSSIIVSPAGGLNNDNIPSNEAQLYKHVSFLAGGWTWKLPQAAMSVMKECLSSSTMGDTSACIRTMAARALDRAARTQREINLGAGLMLVPDAKEPTRYAHHFGLY